MNEEKLKKILMVIAVVGVIITVLVIGSQRASYQSKPEYSELLGTLSPAQNQGVYFNGNRFYATK